MKCGSCTCHDLAFLSASEGRNASKSQDVDKGHKALVRLDFPAKSAGFLPYPTLHGIAVESVLKHGKKLRFDSEYRLELK